MSREEFAAKYGADPAAIEKVRAFAREHSLTVGEVSVARRTVKLKGTAANMSLAFGVQLEKYGYEGQDYRARIGTIELPEDVAESVEAVLGLDNRPQARAHFRIRTETANAASSVSYTPRQVASLYQFRN